ncbi:MAG: redox-sensitive transcriptional activator SoxR, partial [Gammaproteobacteria bacterium]
MNKSNKLPKELSVGQVASRCGVAVSAIHFYETKGLIESWRNAGNQRRYTRDVLRRIAVIKTAQHLGISLKSIAEALNKLPSNRTPTAADWAKLSRQWKDDLNARILKLEQLRDDLDGCIG